MKSTPTQQKLKETIRPIVESILKEYMSGSPVDVVTKWNPIVGAAYRQYMKSILQLQTALEREVDKNTSDDVFEFTMEANKNIRKYLVDLAGKSIDY